MTFGWHGDQKDNQGRLGSCQIRKLLKANVFESVCNLHELLVNLLSLQRTNQPTQQIERYQAIVCSHHISVSKFFKLADYPVHRTKTCYPHHYGPQRGHFSYRLRFTSLVHSGRSGQDSQTGSTQTGPGPPCPGQKTEVSRLTGSSWFKYGQEWSFVGESVDGYGDYTVPRCASPFLSHNLGHQDCLGIGLLCTFHCHRRLRRWGRIVPCVSPFAPHMLGRN